MFLLNSVLIIIPNIEWINFPFSIPNILYLCIEVVQLNVIVFSLLFLDLREIWNNRISSREFCEIEL